MVCHVGMRKKMYSIITNLERSKRIIKALYVKIYGNKFEKLEEMENFLAKYKLSKSPPKR